VIEGVIEIRKLNHAGQKAVLARVGPGNTLGEMSLLDARPRSADCVVMEPTTFAVLDRSMLELLLRTNPALVNKILTQIILILSEYVRRLSGTLSETLQAPV
jgi:CRP-like cAMP-binding protein